jgi:hypothetical protein
MNCYLVQPWYSGPVETHRERRDIFTIPRCSSYVKVRCTIFLSPLLQRQVLSDKNKRQLCAFQSKCIVVRFVPLTLKNACTGTTSMARPGWTRESTVVGGLVVAGVATHSISSTRYRLSNGYASASRKYEVLRPNCFVHRPHADVRGWFWRRRWWQQVRSTHCSVLMVIRCLLNQCPAGSVSRSTPDQAATQTDQMVHETTFLTRKKRYSAPAFHSPSDFLRCTVLQILFCGSSFHFLMSTLERRLRQT